MQPNPLLKKLGFAPDDRVAIIHTDDIGMCQASISAFADLWQAGIISSGAVMVPCPWFLEAAAYCRLHPEVDMGVHATLTSEWPTYRWRPLSTVDLSSGLIDGEGFFYPRSEDVQAHATPEAVGCELEAQIERALAAGIRPTHMDTHMGAVASPRFIPVYVQMALGRRLPPMLFRMDEAGWRQVGLDAETAALAAGFVQQLEASGAPLLDHIGGVHLDQTDNRLERTKQALAGLAPGITHFIIHPSKDTPELRAITPDWSSRVADYEIFLREDIRQYIKNLGIHVIGYRAVQDTI